MVEVCPQCLFDRKSGFSFVYSGIEPFNGSNQPQKTPTNDKRRPAEPSPDDTQSTQDLQSNFDDPRLL